MSRLDALKKSQSLQDLALVLGYKPKAIAYILFKIDEEAKYSTFEVAKKSGGKRVISKPCDKLKALQRSVATLLYDCIEEIKPKGEGLVEFRGEHKKLARADRAKNSISHGYEKGLSIASNASMHTNKRYVYNIDIKSFFPSFNFGRVRGFFLKNKNFRLHPRVATLLAQVACHKNELPQGSPCSPVISNLICKSLDFALMSLARNNSCTYTRYVDDLTFSTNLQTFPKAIALKPIFSLKKEQWKLGKAAEKIILNAGFEINKSKCRMQSHTSHQEVTGLTVNRKVNVSNSYYRQVRAMSHSLFTKGYFYKPRRITPPPKSSWLKSVFNTVCSFTFRSKQEEVKTSLNKDRDMIESVEPIVGMLAHIYNIKSYRNRFVRKGFRPNIHDGIRTKANGKIEFPTINRSQTYEDDNHVVAIDGVKNLYGKLLFFKYFYHLKKPLIVCEGKTDNIYLKCALDRLSTSFPTLAKDSDGKNKITFFNRTDTNSEMLKLAEGTPGLSYLISIYKRFMKMFTCEGKKFPVIFIVDNDTAGKGFVQKAKKIRDENRKAKKITTVRHRHYYFENVYIVTIPSKNRHDKDVEDIEDLFDDDILSRKLGEKTFSKENNGLDNSKHYGKTYFAEHVITQSKKSINFDSFRPLFADVLDIIKTYDPKNLD